MSDDDTNGRDREINRKRRCQEDTTDFVDLSLTLPLIPSRHTRIRLSLSDSPPSAPTHQEEAQEAAEQSLLLQTLFAPVPTPLALQLSPSHPLLAFPLVPEPTAYAPASTSVTPAAATDGKESISNYCAPVRRRKNPNQTPGEGKSETVTPPFPWATDRRATVQSLERLLSKEMSKISGEVQCKRCEKQYQMEYDLTEKFFEIGSFIAENKSAMHDRAPAVWMYPTLPKCKFCKQENSAKPVIAEKKKAINWLFMFLGQMLGCCTLEQLKYFCKHTGNHRTGAKDRVLYLAYLNLCKQLDPSGPFDR